MVKISSVFAVKSFNHCLTLQVTCTETNLKMTSRLIKKRLKKFIFVLLSALFTILTSAAGKPTLPFSLPSSFGLPTFNTFQKYIEKKQTEQMKTYRYVICLIILHCKLPFFVAIFFGSSFCWWKFFFVEKFIIQPKLNIVKIKSRPTCKYFVTKEYQQKSC